MVAEWAYIDDIRYRIRKRDAANSVRSFVMKKV